MALGQGALAGACVLPTVCVCVEAEEEQLEPGVAARARRQAQACPASLGLVTHARLLPYTFKVHV